MVVDRARDFAHRVGEEGVDERVDGLILRGCFADAEEQACWMQWVATPPAPFTSIQVYDPEISGDVGVDETFDPTRLIHLSIRKPTANGAAAFIFATAAANYLAESEPAPCLWSAELPAAGAFTARGLTLSPWDVGAAIAQGPKALPIHPRKLVRDYVPTREIAEDLSPWLINSLPAVETPEYCAWKSQSARRLLGALVTSAALRDGAVWLEAAGPPVFRIEALDPEIPAAWKQITACAEWVFVDGRDTEVRHLLFAAELARSFQPHLAFSDHLARALESAQTSYQAHVQSASRETLKALGDLRKQIVDETQKVSQRAQDLTGSLWRDAAISATPFVIKAMTDANRSSPMIATGLYVGAAALIIAVYWLQLQINRYALADQKAARTAWFRSLYGHISQDERAEIAEQPIAKAEKRYRWIAIAVGLLHGVMVGILLTAAIITWQNHSGTVATQPRHSRAQPPIQSQTGVLGTANRHPDTRLENTNPVGDAAKSNRTFAMPNLKVTKPPPKRKAD